MKKIFSFPCPINETVFNNTLNTANMRHVIVFKAPVSGSFTDFELPCEAGGGTRTNIFESTLYNVSNLLPTGSILSTDASWTPGNASNAVSTFDDPYSITIGTWYAISIRNTNGTPATNYGVLRHGVGRQNDTLSFISDDGGTSYNEGRFGVPINLKIGGEWYGSYCGRFASNTLTANVLYNTSGSRIGRFGSILYFPEQVTLQDIQFPIYRVGTLTGGYVSAEIWNNLSLIASSIDKYPIEALTTSTAARIVTFRFNNTVIPSGSSYRYVLRMNGSATIGDASNYIVVKGHAPVTNVPTSSSNIMDYYLGGTWCTDVTPSSWTDYNTSSGPFPAISVSGEYSLQIGGPLVGPSLVN